VQAADRLVTQAVRRGGRWLVVLAVVAVLGAVTELLLPFVLGRTVDSLTTARPDGTTWLIGCAVLVTTIVVCDTLRVWASGASGAQVAAWLRERTVGRVLGVGPAMTRRFADGDLVTRAGINAEEAGRAPESMVTAATLLIPAVGSLVALVLIDPWLALTLVGGLVLIMVVLRGFLRETTAIATGYQQAQSDIATRLVDALAGARTIAAAGTAGKETQRVLTQLPRVHEYAVGLWRANARAGIQAAVVVPLLEVIVLAVGGLRLAQGDLSIGDLYAAARYTLLGAGIGSAVGYVNRLARARAAAGRVAETLDERPMAYGTARLPTGLFLGIGGTLEFDRVAADGLGEIDLVVPGGYAVAVVGRSGSGKSRLAALAGRLADPVRGTVLLDGVPLPELAHRELRRAVGYAFERPVLVGETVTEAIGLGLDVPDEGAVLAAARAACADPFIRRLPQDYRTRLDEAPMSGGERQRLGLARAFAHGRCLLILDDATSSLDTVTERQVTAALTGHLRNRTHLIVAHRVATAARADRVIWLQDGRVRGYDRHRVLWANPAYRAVFAADAP
jgi:ATP-binding cassette, subfamily B, bacterial